MLTDATATLSCEDIAIRMETHVALYKESFRNVAWLNTHSLLISEERPKNAVDKRQAAVAVFVYKHSHTDYDFAQMHRDLEAMRKLGRTERWQNAIHTWQVVLQEDQNTDWALTQYSIYTNYAALLR